MKVFEQVVFFARVILVPLLVSEVRAHFVTSFPERIETDEGEKVVLTCELSDGDASVIWFKDGRRVVTSDTVTIEEAGAERKLIISNAAPEDSGEYECATVDKKSRAQTQLRVKGEIFFVKLSKNC